MNFVPILYFLVLFGALQGIFLLFAINRIKDRNKKANKVLSILILSISLILISRLSYGPLFLWQPKLAMVPDIIVFVFGPLLYIYIQTLLNKSYRFTSIQWLHFLPAVIHFFILLKSFLIPDKEYLEMYKAGAFYLRNYIILGSALVYCIIYLTISYLLIKNYKSQVEKSLSFRQKTKYLFSIVYLMALILGIWLTSYLFALLSGRPSLNFHIYNFLWIALSFVTYLMGYFAMTQPEIFKINNIKIQGDTKEKYQSSTASKKELDQLKEKLEAFMINEKPYLKPNLTIDDLAQDLNTKSHTLSRLINERFKKNFFDFINSYRVEEFITLALKEEYKKLTFLAIAFEAGFNNKTSFNKAFKKSKNQTPSQYFKSLKENIDC